MLYFRGKSYRPSNFNVDHDKVMEYYWLEIVYAVTAKNKIQVVFKCDLGPSYQGHETITE